VCTSLVEVAFSGGLVSEWLTGCEKRRSATRELRAGGIPRGERGTDSGGGAAGQRQLTSTMLVEGVESRLSDFGFDFAGSDQSGAVSADGSQVLFS
jgi:hypothetical protein